MRAPRLLAAAGLVALLTTGCGTVRAGAAATVGDERITTTQLEQVVSRGLADPTARQNVGSDRPGFERSVLARLVQHLVLADAAKRAGVSIDGAAVDAAFDGFAAQLGGPAGLRAEAVKAGIAPQDLRGVIADSALRDALADKLTASIDVPVAVLHQAYDAGIAQFDQVHSAHILVSTQALAQQLLTKVQADPSQFAALAAQYSLDTSNKGQGGDLGFQGRGALQKPFEDAIFAAKPGTFVLAHTTFGFHVIHVIERRTTTFEQAVPQLRRTLLNQPRQEAIGTALHDAAVRLGVHVNPRFGRFDPNTADVVPVPVCPDTAVSSPSPRPATGQQAQAQPSPSPSC
jgi:parvulin-like peptidyl-prolyl isomerase